MKDRKKNLSMAFQLSLAVFFLHAFNTHATTSKVSCATGKLTYTNSIGIEMVRIDTGTFKMGSTSGNWDEQPIHIVRISMDYFISKNEISLKQYKQFNPKYGKASLNGKVKGVSWNDAVAFCKWLSAKEGVTYRLPTEAEWELAAKRNTLPLNAPLVGLLDNVLEWCIDWYAEYRPDAQIDPVGPDQGMVRVIRGGKIDGDDSVIESYSYSRNENRSGMPPNYGMPRITSNVGFRVVQASMPVTPPYAAEPRLFRSGVKQSTERMATEYAQAKPFFRKRYLLPSPIETSISLDAIDVLGFHPAMRSHNHSPGLEVMPNGDVLVVMFTSWSEYEPEVSLIAARLRYGQDQWEMPDYAFDFAGANDHAPMLWKDGSDVHLFWGSPCAQNATPFQWITSKDNGASWGTVNFPNFVTPIEGHSRQPINTALRNADGHIFISSDAQDNVNAGIDNAQGKPSASASVLWVSEDSMKTWKDNGGRTFARHTTFALGSDGRTIIGMGGKNWGIDGYMPISTSTDEGKTWVISKSIFPEQGPNQRPSILRLKSGVLLMTGDYKSRYGNEANEFKSKWGSYLAYSKDDGKTWIFKGLPGGQSHESGSTLLGASPTQGYTVLRQAPNGNIHLIGTMTKPCLHFEFNEAWLKSKETESNDDAVLMQNPATLVSNIQTYSENYPNGQKHVEWSAGVANDGRYLQEGTEKWYYPSGKLQYEATFAIGEKVGKEIFYNPDGYKIWEWAHNKNGESVYTVYYRNGKKKAESEWKNFHANGRAQRWYENGEIKAVMNFANGEVIK